MLTPFEIARREAKDIQYWKEAAQELIWDAPFQSILDDSNPPFYKWFVGGELNTCFNAVDRHVKNGLGDKTAIFFDSAMTGTKRQISYRQLQDEVAKTAGMIAAEGVSKGDRVVIYMPMIPETVFAMLACARLGAVHSVVFGGFAANELATRIDDAQPVLILSASCGLEPARVVAYKPLLDEAINLAEHKPKACIVFQRDELNADLTPSRDKDWVQSIASAQPTGCVSVAATDPLYILYTSGTTGIPKGVVRDNGGHAIAMLWSLKNVYGARQGDVYWAASDVGWVVGHSYIVYAPLLLGCTTVLYEGKPVGTPDAGAFWRMIEEYKINILFTAPTAIRAIKRLDSHGEMMASYDLSSLRALFLAGERADPDTIYWSEKALEIPVIDNWWQTELGWPAIATCMGLGETQTLVGSAGQPVPGYNIECLSPEHQPVSPGETGDIVLKMPLPPGCLPTLWNNEEGFRSAYLSAHPGYYLTGDAGYIDENGYVHVMSRTDDIINVAGHRLATGAIEQVVSAHADVAECAVIGAPDEIKGEVPMAFIVLNAKTSLPNPEILKGVLADVRGTIGPVAAFKKAVIVSALPKTRSGKTLRGIIRKIAHGETYNMPATIEDPSALEAIKTALL